MARPFADDAALPSRAVATKLNPLICEVYTEDTLRQVADTASDIGRILALADDGDDYPETPLGRMHLLFDVLAAALEYEAETLTRLRIETRRKLKAA